VSKPLRRSSLIVIPMAWLAATITIDVLIVACVGYGLWKFKTGWTHTDALVRKLMMYVPNSETPIYAELTT